MFTEKFHASQFQTQFHEMSHSIKSKQTKKFHQGKKKLKHFSREKEGEKTELSLEIFNVKGHLAIFYGMFDFET